MKLNEFLNNPLIESIDPNKALKYIKDSDTIDNAREQLSGVTQIDSQMFEYENIKYIILSFVKSGIMEFHFFEDDGETFITTKRTMKHARSDVIFSTVMKYIIERVKYKNPQKVLIIGEKDRIKLYSMIINKVIDNYLKEYQLSTSGLFNNPDMGDYEMYQWIIIAKGNKMLETLKR